MALEEQGDMKERRTQEAEDRRREEEQRKQSAEEGSPEAGGEDSPDTVSSTLGVPAQQETEQPGRQLTCLEIPDFLRSDAIEGSAGN